MIQKLVLRNEVVKVKGRVKVITVKKEEFNKFLQLKTLRILDKEYYALMPPVDSFEKNSIDINGLATLVQQFVSAMINNIATSNTTSPAQMVLITQSGNVALAYTSNINLNSQGVTVYMQVLQESGNYTFQYYYIGFDTTNDSYSVSQLELYVSAYRYTNYTGCGGTLFSFYTDMVRIAYTNASFTKAPDSYLFIVWLIEFQNIPPYLIPFTPTLQNNVGISIYNNCGCTSGFTVYFNNGNCDFGCGGNCPSTGLNGFIMYVNNNSVILEFPLTAPLSAGVTSLEIMLCDNTCFANMPNTSGSISATVTPPVSGGTFYVAIATITITYQGS